MLKIRNEQMEIFQPVAEAAFIRRVSDYLREYHSHVAVQLSDGVTIIDQIPESKLHQLIQNGAARARNYGLTTESALVSFIVVMFTTAPNFDNHPLIQRLLKDEKFAPDDRIDRLWHHISEQNWEKVKADYDAATWFIDGN